MSSQATCSRSERPAGCPRARAASGLTGSMRVSELVAEEDIPRRPTARRTKEAEAEAKR